MAKKKAAANVVPQKKLRDYYSFDSYKKLWKEEVEPNGHLSLCKLVRNWSSVRKGFEARNGLVHGKDILFFLTFLGLCFILLFACYNKPQSLTVLQRMIAEQGECVIPVASDNLILKANSSEIQGDGLILQNSNELGESVPVKVYIGEEFWGSHMKARLYYLQKKDAYILQYINPEGRSTGAMTAYLNWSPIRTCKSLLYNLKNCFDGPTEGSQK